MIDDMTCEEFNARLYDFVADGMSGSAASAMKAHLDRCDRCREIYAIKQALFFDTLDPDKDVPAEVEMALVDAVITDVSAAGESGRDRHPWLSRYLMPALAAAIVIFVFLTGFMLGEIRDLHREAGELRDEVAVMETVLSGRNASAGAIRGGRQVLRHLTGGLGSASTGITIGEVSRLLEAIPENTQVFTEAEAKRLIALDRRLKRFAGHMDERPWEGGLTSGELLLVIISLDIDPETRIPDEWRNSYRSSRITEEKI